jgi:hypothetical protein
MTLENLKSTITQLVDFLIHNATPNPNKPMLTEFFWPEERQWHPRISNFDDTGDILPFIAWAGVIYKKPAWLKFAKTQYQWWINHARHPSGWYQAIIDHSNLEPNKSTFHLRPSTLVSLYDHQDALTGLYNLHLLTKDPFYSRSLDQLLEQFSTLALKTHGIIPNQLLILNKKEIPHPLTSTNPAVSGLVAEHLFLRGTQTNNQKFIQAGHLIINFWLKTRFFKTHHLLPQGLHPYLPNFPLTPQTFLYPTTKIMKENSNMLYALLQQPDTYQQPLTQLINKLLTFQHPSGAFFPHYHIKSKTVIKDHFDKTQNFTIIDLLTDLATASFISTTHTGDTFNQSPKFDTLNNTHQDRTPGVKRKTLIETAIRCANFWISHQNSKTKLIPDYVAPDSQAKHPIAKLDQSADLYSSLLRLYSLTNDDKYLKAAQTGAQALQKFFTSSQTRLATRSLGEGWPHRIISTTTGQPATDQQVPPSDRPAGRNLTKYVGGALRFYLSLYQVKKGKNMQKDQALWTLSRDR